MRILVILLFLLTETCTNIKAADCYDDQDCMHYECDSDKTPYCQIKTHHQHNQPDHDDKKRQSNPGSCHCGDLIHCRDDYDCDRLTCSGNLSPACNSVHGHHRCLCTYQPVKHPETTQRVVTTLNPVAQSYVHCKQHSDCTSHKCSTDKPTPYCKHDYALIIFETGRHCDCTECVEDRDCSCTAGTTPYCEHHLLSHNFGTCQCNPTMTYTSRETSTSRGSTTTTTASTSRGSTTTTTAFTPKESTATTTAATTVTTTTSVPPPTVTQLSTAVCHNHGDCSGHICPSDKHPYCKFDRYSSTCHCTVCTEHKHCFCPQGLIGQCHFDYIHNSHSCVCGLAPDTTPTATTSSTSKFVPTATLRSTSVSSKSTTNSTPIPATPQPTTFSSTSASKSTSRMVSIASSLSVSSSTLATSPPTTSATSPISPISTSATSPTSTSVPSTNQGIRKCHTCGDANNSISCDTRTIYLGNLQSCAPGEDFCMTDIIHDGHAYPKTYKRCVSGQECRNKWLHQSSDQEYCTNYGNVLMSGQYSCHFCCVSDGCNAGQVPDKSTFYTKV